MSSTKTLQEKLDEEKSLNDFKSNIENVILELEENPDNIENLTEDEITEIRKHINPYGSTIDSDDKRYTCLSYTNMTKEYLTKLLTTTMVGFLYRMCDEYEIADYELNDEVNDEDFMDSTPNLDINDKVFYENKVSAIYNKNKYNYIKENNLIPSRMVEEVMTPYKTSDDIFKYVSLTEDDELIIQKLSNDEVADFFKPTVSLNKIRKMEHIEKMINKQSLEEQKIIKRFLNGLFEYNPDLHTQSIYHENKEDIERNSITPAHSSIKDDTNKLTEEQLLHTKIPPNDTFLRFNYYYDVNFETMQDVVKDLYTVKPDIDIMVNVFESFDSLDEAEHYVKKHKNEVITDILTLTNNNWNVIGPYKKNRERINFYNDNTAILESIFKQQEEDAKLGAELMKTRIRKKKKRNVKYMGKDDPKFKEYVKQNPNSVSNMGAVKIEEEGDQYKITEEYDVSETGSKIDTDGIPEDSVKIGVTSINAKSGKINNSEIYTKAKAADGSGALISKT